MDCSPPGSSVHGLLQAILQAILEWAAIVYWALGKVPWPQVLIPDNTFEHCHFSGHKWNRVSLWTSIKHTERLGMWTELCIWSCTSLILLKPQPAAQIRFRNAVPGFLGNEVSLSYQYFLVCLAYKLALLLQVRNLFFWELRAQSNDLCVLGVRRLILSPLWWRGQTHVAANPIQPADSQLTSGPRTWFQGQEGNRVSGWCLSLSLFSVMFLRTELKLTTWKPQKPSSFPPSPKGTCSLLSFPAQVLIAMYSLGCC